MMIAADIDQRFHVEAWVAAKERTPGAPCEDLVGMHGNTFWVIDGASTPRRWQLEPEQLPASSLVQIIDSAFRAAFALIPNISLTGLITMAREKAFAQIRERHPDIPYERLLVSVPHAAVLIVRIHESHIEYASLQDNTLLIQAAKMGAPLEIRDQGQECFNAAYYAAIASALMQEGSAGPQYDRLLDEMVDRERKLRNHPGGFFTFTGLTMVEQYAIYGNVAIGPGAKLVLTSDGGARYWSIFDQPKADMFNLDLQDIAQRIRLHEAKDPQSATFPRIGWQDDIALLRITVV